MTDATPISYYIALSVVLFSIGAVGVLLRRNAIVIFMCDRADAECREPGVRRLRAAALRGGRTGDRVLRHDGRRRRGGGRPRHHHRRLPPPTNVNADDLRLLRW
jgi:hypothetical protein